MDEGLSPRNFGLLIAYGLPGFTVVVGLGFVSEPVHEWLRGTTAAGPTVGAFLFVALGSIGAGLLASTVRWIFVDSLHHATGLEPPSWDYSRFPETVQAYDYLTEIHYRYYQFYGNSFVAILFAYMLWRFSGARGLGWLDLSLALTEVVLLAGSRDTLQKYYRKTAVFLGNEVPHD